MSTCTVRVRVRVGVRIRVRVRVRVGGRVGVRVRIHVLGERLHGAPVLGREYEPKGLPVAQRGEANAEGALGVLHLVRLRLSIRLRVRVRVMVLRMVQLDVEP